jgi:hypothetical protein
MIAMTAKVKIAEEAILAAIGFLDTMAHHARSSLVPFKSKIQFGIWNASKFNLRGYQISSSISPGDTCSKSLQLRKTA